MAQSINKWQLLLFRCAQPQFYLHEKNNQVKLNFYQQLSTFIHRDRNSLQVKEPVWNVEIAGLFTDVIHTDNTQDVFLPIVVICGYVIS